MNETKDFLNLPLSEVVAGTPGAKVLHEVDVPGRKMMGVVVGVAKGEHAELHCFGVRKSDGLITTRFDTPKLRLLENTSLGINPTLRPEHIAKFERNALRMAALNRLARNFYRRVVKTPELLAGGLEYYSGLIETQFVWALAEQVAILNQSKVSPRKPDFPEWRGTFRFELRGEKYSCIRRLSYDEATKLITAQYTFVGGDGAGRHLVYGAMDAKRVKPEDRTASVTLVTHYANGQWENASDFADKNEAFLTAFYEFYPVAKQK